MRANRHPPLAMAVLALACGAAAALHSGAAAQCNFTALASETPVPVNTSPAFFSFYQSDPFWTAIAVGAPASADWDLSVWQDTYPYPGCVTTLLAGSAYGAGITDFVVGDFNHNPIGTYYAEANLYNGSGSATVEWDARRGTLVVNASLSDLTFSGGQLLGIWDVWLNAGTTYQFEVLMSGSAAIHALLFRNATGGTCWKRRADAEFDVLAATSYTTRSYVAPTSGFYGVVLVNDNGASGYAQIGVQACTPPIPLASGVPQGSILALNYYSFDQEQPRWAAVGMRNDASSSLYLNRSNPGAPPIVCFDGYLAGSSYGSYANVIVGDFHYNAPGTYYAQSIRSINIPPHLGVVEWDDGSRELTVNGMTVTGSLSGSDVLRVWDVFLEAGRTYHFGLSHAGADLKLLLFRNSGSGEYWGDRGERVLETTGEADYVAPSSGDYAAVIVNDNGADGTYSLSVGTCYTPLTLVSGSPIETFLAETYVQFDMGSTSWTAIGVRGSEADWDIAVQSGSAQPFPVCHGPELASSNAMPPVSDFVVGDFNHNAAGVYYAWPHAFQAQGGGSGSILWDAGGGVMQVNGQLAPAVLDPDHFLRIWDVYLTAGTLYWLRYFGDSGLSGDSLLLFRNPTVGEYWASRSKAVARNPGGEDYYFLAPATDWYGVAVVSNGGQGTAHAGIGTCSPPSALSPGTTVATGLARNYYSFAQASTHWTALGARSATPWQLWTYGSPSGSQYPGCFGNPLTVSSSQTPARAEVVVGDFNRNAPGTCYGYLAPVNEFQAMQPATLEWDSGSDDIVVGAAPVNRATGAGDVLEVWDCRLNGLKPYTFHFTHTGAADLRLLIFRNTANGAYWAGRDAAQIELAGTATWKTTSASGEIYGLVVVNDNGQPGSYSLWVTDPGTLDADAEGPAPATAFEGARPNPAAGDVALHFALHEPAEVSFEVLDMAGRQVAMLPAQAYGAGRWTAAWTRRAPAGARLAAGVYFVRMKAADRVIGTTRLALVQ